MSVGGGVRSVAEVAGLLRAGADKVSLNTAAIARPQLLAEAAERFGSQCVVLSVDARRPAGPGGPGGPGGYGGAGSPPGSGGSPGGRPPRASNSRPGQPSPPAPH